MWIKIFKSGVHTATDGKEYSFTDGDLDQMVEVYNNQPEETRRQAPHVVGHPAVEKESFGWVQKLRRVGDTLEAFTTDFQEEFKEAVNSGKYRFRSASFYPHNKLLRHVGWLGAAQPAVPGLGVVKFSEGPDDAFVEFGEDWYDDTVEEAFRTVSQGLQRLREYIIEKDGAEKANAIVSAELVSNLATVVMPKGYSNQSFERQLYQLEDKVLALSNRLSEALNQSFSQPLSGNTPMTPNQQDPQGGTDAGTEANSAPAAAPTADFAALQQSYDALKAEKDALSQRLRVLELAATENEMRNFCQGLVTEGRMLPADVEYHVKDLVLKANMPSFSQDGKTPLQEAKEFLAARPVIEALSKQDFAQGGAPAAELPDTADFAAFVGARDGDTFDPDSMAVMQKAQAIAKERNCTLNEAITIAMKGQ